jgi:hypothetical protein
LHGPQPHDDVEQCGAEDGVYAQAGAVYDQEAGEHEGDAEGRGDGHGCHVAVWRSVRAVADAFHVGMLQLCGF